jgi:hypothetical protein
MMERNPYGPPSSVTQVAPEDSSRASPAGLSGWLVLIGLGLVITPFRLAIYLLQTFPPIFRDSTWRVLTTPGSAPYHPLWAPLLLAEIAINLLCIVISIYLLFLFFQKSWRFPKVYIIFLIVNLGFIVTDAFAVRIILPERPILDPGTAREFGRSLFGVIIWVPYLLLSKRVRNTFVRSTPHAPAERTLEK